MQFWELKATDWGRFPRCLVLLISWLDYRIVRYFQPSLNGLCKDIDAMQHEKIIAFMFKQGHS
jgi:hypothetical protein